MRLQVLVIGTPESRAAAILRPLAEIVIVADRFEAAARAKRKPAFSMIVAEAHTTIECFELRALAKRFPWIPERSVVCLWTGEPHMALVLQQATGCTVLLAARAGPGLLLQLELVKARRATAGAATTLIEASEERSTKNGNGDGASRK